MHNSVRQCHTVTDFQTLPTIPKSSFFFHHCQLLSFFCAPQVSEQVHSGSFCQVPITHLFKFLSPHTCLLCFQVWTLTILAHYFTTQQSYGQLKGLLQCKVFLCCYSFLKTHMQVTVIFKSLFANILHCV